MCALCVQFITDLHVHIYRDNNVYSRRAFRWTIDKHDVECVLWG